METHQIFGIAAAVLTTSVAHADLVMLSGVDKRHYQVGAQKLVFDSGELNVFVRDGITVLAPCAYDPLINFLPPVLGCPLGTTGFIASGDVDRDGIRDDNQYWSVASVAPAFVIEPSRPELAQLYAAPPSKLPRPLANFRDDSVITFYNIMEPETFRAYDQTRYELIRRYGPVRQVETAVAVGTVIDPEWGDVDRSGEIEADETDEPVFGAIEVIVTMEGVDLPTIFVPVLGPERGEVAADDTPGDGPEVWAAKVRNELEITPAIANVYNVSGDGNAIVLTERVPDGNDPTLNIELRAAPADAAATPPRPDTDLNAAPDDDSANTTLGSVAGGSTPAAALKQMDEELVPGQYIFTYPRLGNPEGNPVGISVAITPNLEAVNPASRTRTGFRITSGLWDGEYYQMDPRVSTRVTWTGNDRTVIRPGDTIHLSILNPEEDFLTFPPTVPQSPILLSPTVQQYQIPPYFYEVGEEGVFRLTFDRFSATTGVSFDTSQRDFRAKLRMVDSYAGYASITLPLGTPRRELSTTADYDRDGMTNVTEFAYEVLTYDAVNAAARDQFVPNPTGLIDLGDIFGDTVQRIVEVFNRVDYDAENAILDPSLKPVEPEPPALDADGHLVFTVPIRPETGNTLKYTLGVLEPGAKKPKAVKMSGVWEVTRVEDQTEIPAEQALVLVDWVGEITGDVLATEVPQDSDPGEVIIVTHESVQFRTLAPWPVGVPIPDLRVIITAVPLR